MVLEVQPPNDQRRNATGPDESVTPAEMEIRQIRQSNKSLAPNAIGGNAISGSTTETTAFTIYDPAKTATQVAFLDKGSKRAGKESDEGPEGAAKPDDSLTPEKLGEKLRSDLDTYLDKQYPKMEDSEKTILREIVALLTSDPESAKGRAEAERYLPKGTKTLTSIEGAEALRKFLGGYGIVTYAITNNRAVGGVVTDTMTALAEDPLKALSNIIKYKVENGKRSPTIAGTQLVTLEPAEPNVLGRHQAKRMGLNTVKVTDRIKEPTSDEVKIFRDKILGHLAEERVEPIK